MTNPWSDPQIAPSMRANADGQIREWVPGDGNTPHFDAFVTAVASTECPGSILEIGCGIGHNRELLDRVGVKYESFAGIDVNEAATVLAKERYPESQWYRVTEDTAGGQYPAEVRSDIVIDGSAILHIEDWKQHIGRLCNASRRWVILHRFPITRDASYRVTTEGYGHEFKSQVFNDQEVFDAMKSHGFELVRMFNADGNSMTIVFAKVRHWATYCDSAYLPRLKALHASMMKHCKPFKLHVLAWYRNGEDEWAATAPNVEVGHAVDLQLKYPEYSEPNLPGPPRTKVELFWTMGPRWIADVMEKTGEPVTYIDSDLMFFSSPEPMFGEIGGAPAGVIPHAFAEARDNLPGPKRETHEVCGRFNVGIVHIADKAVALRWAEQCHEWCYDRLDKPDNPLADRYADQRYLDAWPAEGAHVVTHPGAAPGPWCIHTRALDVRDGQIYFGGKRLIAYHYSAMIIHEDETVSASRPEYLITPRQQEVLYRPYLAALDEVSK